MQILRGRFSLLNEHCKRRKTAVQVNKTWENILFRGKNWEKSLEKTKFWPNEGRNFCKNLKCTVCVRVDFLAKIVMHTTGLKGVKRWKFSESHILAFQNQENEGFGLFIFRLIFSQNGGGVIIK